MSPLGDDRYSGQPPGKEGSGPEAEPSTDGTSSALSLSAEIDSDALATQLSERFRDRLRFFAARRLRDRDAAEDVAQEVLRRTLEALRAGKVENREALPGFLFQTARNVCMQWGRTEGRKARAFTRLRSDEEDPESDPLAGLITDERRERVREAFAQLAPADREVLLLSYVEVLGAEEIAAQLHLTIGAVRVRRHRALNRLAEILGVTDRSHREL
jgi:RNA polymerase sigma-70 factor (ECF subfamily)